jgi:SPOR domain
MIVLQFALPASKVCQEMIWRHLVIFLLTAILGSAASRVAPAQSADITAALTEASKVMEKGGYAKAVEMIDEALRTGKIPSDLAAKALLLRAEANEKLGRAAFALSDYNSSLWMQGLSAVDRKRADEGRARVTKTLGVSEQKDATAPPSPNGGASSQPARKEGAASQREPAKSAAAARQQQANGKDGGIGGFFANLFESSTSSQQQGRPPQQESPSSAVALAKPPAGEPQARSKATPPKNEAAKPAPLVTASINPPAEAKPAEGGTFAIQLAAVAQEDKAIAETDRIARKYSADLGGRSPSLMIVPTADGGTLYKVVLAPYGTRSEGEATCALLKTKGLSCMLITKR